MIFCCYPFASKSAKGHNCVLTFDAWYGERHLENRITITTTTESMLCLPVDINDGDKLLMCLGDGNEVRTGGVNCFCVLRGPGWGPRSKGDNWAKPGGGKCPWDGPPKPENLGLFGPWDNCRKAVGLAWSTKIVIWLLCKQQNSKHLRHVN